jgi:hypothetical protein
MYDLSLKKETALLTYSHKVSKLYFVYKVSVKKVGMHFWQRVDTYLRARARSSNTSADARSHS